MTPKLTRVVRLDSVPLDKAYYTDEGYLADRPVLTAAPGRGFQARKPQILSGQTHCHNARRRPHHEG